jgi:hypothetical protein
VKVRLATLAVALAGLAASAAFAAPMAPSGTSASAQAMCGSGYVSANLPWGHKCLRVGEYCKVGNRAYLRFGFYCPAGGHLRRR